MILMLFTYKATERARFPCSWRRVDFLRSGNFCIKYPAMKPCHNAAPITVYLDPIYTQGAKYMYRSQVVRSCFAMQTDTGRSQMWTLSLTLPVTYSTWHTAHSSSPCYPGRTRDHSTLCVSSLACSADDSWSDLPEEQSPCPPGTKGLAWKKNHHSFPSPSPFSVWEGTLFQH